MKLVILVLCFFNATGHSQTVSEVEGEVKVRLARNGVVSRAHNNEALGKGDTVMSGPSGKCKIVLKGGDEIDVEPSSEFQIEDFNDEPANNKRLALFNLLQGQIHARVAQKYDGDTQ